MLVTCTAQSRASAIGAQMSVQEEAPKSHTGTQCGAARKDPWGTGEEIGTLEKERSHSRGTGKRSQDHGHLTGRSTCRSTALGVWPTELQ